MSIDKIQSLLEESNRLYIGRSLSEAIEVANKALSLSGEKSYLKGLVHSNLLLGQFYNTSAKYQGDRTIYNKALVFLNSANELSQSSNENGQTIDILLAIADNYVSQGDYRAAEEYLSKALKYATQKNDVKSEIRIQCATSQLAITQNDFTKAKTLVENAQKQLEQLASYDQALAAECFNQLTQISIKRQDYTNLLEFCDPLLHLSRELGDVEKELSALNYLAVYYGVFSDYKRAMQFLLEALDKSKAIHYHNVTAQCLINIGTIYAHFYNYEEALIRYETVLDKYHDVIDANTRVIVFNNVGNIYYSTHKYEEAKEPFQNALDLAREIQYKEMIALSLAQISRINTALRDIDTAQEIANQAQEIIDEIGDVNGRQINLLNLGNINYQKGDMEKAIILTSQGIVAAKRMKDEANEIRGYQLLAKIYQEQKDFEKALQYQMIYSKSQENFAKEQLNRQVMDLEIKYAIQEKQSQIEQLTKENKFQALLLEQKDQIVKQNNQLLQVNEELRQFAYVASHDLKEPLRMIGSYTQLIFRRHGQDFDADSKSYFDFVSEGVVRMNNLLDALLKYATIGKTDESFEEVRLNDAVELALINLRVRIEETKAEINVSEMPVVRSIQSLLIQLFQNLISNALKFKKPDTQSIVNIEAHRKEEEIIISVKDNGIGIAPEYQERIFIIFQRLHSRARYEGTGIGLSICLKIIQRLGGRIWIESEVDKGATFFIALPVDPGQQPITIE